MQINLLPDLVLQRRHDASVKKMATLGLIAWCALVLIVVLGTLGYKVFESTRLNNAKNNYNKLNATVNSKENKAFRAEALEVQASLKALDGLFNQQERMSVIVARLAKLSPRTAVVKDVIVGEGRKVSITGRSTSYFEVGKLLAALKDSKDHSSSSEVYFTDVALGGSNLADTGASFNITMTYVYPLQGGSDALGSK